MAKKPEAIDRELNVSRLNRVVTRGEQKDRLYPENLENGNMFHEDTADYNVMRTDGVSKVKYDMPGKIVANTPADLQEDSHHSHQDTSYNFDLYKVNLEKFIRKVSRIILEQNATIIVTIQLQLGRWLWKQIQLVNAE